MDKKVKPARSFRGSVSVPPDKSITHRAVLLSALARGVSNVQNPLNSEDCLSTLSCVRKLGCQVEKGKDSWNIEGKGLWGLMAAKGKLDCGNSGTTMRLMSGILAAQEFESELVGDASLSQRPMDRIAEPLSAMGAKFSLTKGKFAPFKIKGRRPLNPIHWKSEISSAQVKSAVLLAGLHAEGETVFEEPSLSRDHTERMLRGCGINVDRKEGAIIVRGPSEPKPMNWTVPSDFSSAAFFIAAGLLIDGSEIVLKGINLNPTRTGLLLVLEEMGANLEIRNRQEVGGEPAGDIFVRGKSDLQAVTLSKDLTPRLIDEIPVLAVLATQAKGESVLSGLEELRVKETNRLGAMANNLFRLGAKIRETKDGLIINGPTRLIGGAVDSFLDHRIAMAMAVAGLISKDGVAIQGSESVSISFPDFWNILDELTGPR